MDHFVLHSKYQPTGDQPQAIEELVNGFREGNQFETLLGVTGSGKTFTMANIIAALNKPTLVIAHNKTLAGQLYVAVMGCPVNGPGEAKNADIGLAGGINSYLVFIKGKPVKTLSGPDSVTEFLKMVDQVIDEREKMRKEGKDPNEWRN